MMKTLIKSALFFCFVFSAFCGCSLLCEKEAVSFVLPEAYNEQNVSSWKVVICDSSGISYSAVHASGKKAVLEFRKNSLSSVLAFPVTDDGSIKNPYGTIYPFEVPLDYKNGFASGVLHSLFLSSENAPDEKERFLSRFNWQRFMKECALFEDPWLLDKEQIMKAIADGTFRKNVLK